MIRSRVVLHRRSYRYVCFKRPAAKLSASRSPGPLTFQTEPDTVSGVKCGMGWIGDRCPYPHLLAYSHTRPQDGRKAKVERREGGPAGYTRKPVETYTPLWDTHRRSCILPFVFMISPPSFRRPSPQCPIYPASASSSSAPSPTARACWFTRPSKVPCPRSSGTG